VIRGLEQIVSDERTGYWLIRLMIYGT